MLTYNLTLLQPVNLVNVVSENFYPILVERESLWVRHTPVPLTPRTLLWS